MATKVASLYAEIGANTTGFKKGADDVKGGMNQMAAAMGITSTVVGVTVGVIKEAYDSYSQLAESVRDLSLVSGTSAEETSRFIQVLDDYQLTAQDATSASRFLAKNGLSPTVETLAMLSDQFRAIKDPAEAMVFIQENLGRGGAKWVNVLNQGSAALRANSAAIEGNLILNDQQIKMYEVGRLAIDKYKDKLEGFKVALGQNVGNVLAYADASVRANEIMKEHTIQTGRSTKSTIEYSDALNMAIAEQLQAADASTQQATSMAAAEEAAKAAEEANKALQQSNASFISGAIENTKANEDYRQSQIDIVAQIDELKAKKEAMYPWEIDKIKETQEKIDELSTSYADNATAFVKAMETKAAMMAIDKIEMLDGIAGFSDSEYEKAKQILETTDIATAAAFEEQQAMQLVTDAVATGQISVQDFGTILDQVMADGVVSVDEVTRAINNVPSNKTVTITVNTVQQTGAAAGNIDYSLATQLHIPGGNRAGGGAINAGHSYMVGERGPEMITPSSNGNVIPTNQLGGGMDMKLLARTIVTALQQAA